MQWSAASKKGPLYMPLKAFRLIENGRCPEATAEQALRVDRPPLVFSYTTSSASLPLKGRVRCIEATSASVPPSKVLVMAGLCRSA